MASALERKIALSAMKSRMSCTQSRRTNTLYISEAEDGNSRRWDYNFLYFEEIYPKNIAQQP